MSATAFALPLNAEAFLNVERSARERRWVSRLDAGGRNVALAIAQRTGMPDLVARILAGRGATIGDADGFMTPRLRDLMPDPSTLTACDEAAKRLAQAVARGERVAVFGDYDVDGAASSALVARVLRDLGCEVEIYIPDRITEGYGPNVAAVRGLRERGADLLVTVDCGTMSFEAIDAANGLGLETVVVDHHQTGEELPNALAIVNPNRQDDVSGLDNLCATGVAFMVMVALRRELARSDFPNLMAALDLVALATVCDMVPLRSLNRAFVVQGLAIMRQGRNTGLRALARAARISRALDVGHLGFLIGPRINAGGRVGNAALGAELLSTDDEDRATRIAEQLEGYNRERQAIEARVLEDAENEVQAEMRGAHPPVALVAGHDGWHPGVVGLVASRLKERYDRPAFAIGFDGSGRGTGSARSVPGLDLGALVRRAVSEGLLVKGGGHTMAAGLTIERARMGDFRAFVEEQAARALDPDAVPELAIDGAVASHGVTTDLVDAMEQAGPYGVGHPRPVLVLAEQTLLDARTVGNGHVSLRLRGNDGTAVKGIAFRTAETQLGSFLSANVGGRIHLAGTLSIDDYRGTRNATIRVEDAALPV